MVWLGEVRLRSDWVRLGLGSGKVRIGHVKLGKVKVRVWVWACTVKVVVRVGVRLG